jgi:hypothetical protein
MSPSPINSTIWCRVLTLYALYYNETRTHLGLAKDAPRRRYGDVVTTHQSCADCIIATPGYDFREGQGAANGATIKTMCGGVLRTGVTRKFLQKFLAAGGWSMSAIPPKADMCGATRYVRFGPIADTRET